MLVYISVLQDSFENSFENVLNFKAYDSLGFD